MKKVFLSLFAIFFISGCNTLRDLSNIQKPLVRYSSMSIQDISFQDVTLLFDFEVDNPNGFGVSADQYSYEFFINGMEFVNGTQSENLSIGRQSKSIVQIPVSFSFTELYESVESVVQRDSIAYRISSEVQFDIAGVGKQRVPVSAEGELPLPKLPRIELSNFEIEDLSLTGAEMVAAFRLENPNPFGISFANTFYNLEVNDKKWLDTRLGEIVNLDPSESELISIPIRLSSLQMGSVLLEMLDGETEFEYRLSGSADVSADIEGFTGAKTISFDRTGMYKME